MKRKCLSMVLIMAMMMVTALSVFAQEIKTSDNFLDMTKEEQRAWLEQNVQPSGEWKQGIQDRASGWHYGSKDTTYTVSEIK